MSNKKKSVLSIGLIGLSAIPIATTVSSTSDGTNTNLNLQKVWELKDPTVITQEDVVNLLNKTNYKDSNIVFNTWKEASKKGNHATFSDQKDFPDGYKIPASVLRIAPNAFAGIKFPDNFEIPKTIIDIGEYAFDNAILSEGFKFFPNISEIKKGTFDHAKIHSIMDIPASVVRISEFAFKNAIFHKTVLIHKTVLNIGEKAFQNAIFHNIFNFLPDLKKTAPNISSDFLMGAIFKRSRLFFFPFKEIPSAIFSGVTFTGKKDVVIGNGNEFIIEKLNNLTGVNKSSFDSLKIPETVLKIEKQKNLPEKIANDLYKQVEENIIQDVLKSFYGNTLFGSVKKNTLSINSKLKNNIPSLSVETIKRGIKASLYSIISSNFDGDKPNYVIGDENTKNRILKNSPLKNVDLFFSKGLITITPNDAIGKIIIRINLKIKIDGKEIGTKEEIIFRNFKRTNAGSDATIVDDVIALFDDLKNNSDGTNSTLETKASLLPSSLTNKKSADSLGFIDPSLNKRNGTDVSFDVKEHNNENGKLIIKVTIKKGNAEDSVQFTLKGYQTTTEKAMSDADALQATNLSALQLALKNGGVVKLTNKARDIAQRITNVQTLKAELGIDLTTLATTSSYAISATGNAAGKIIVRVVITTPGASRKKRRMVFWAPEIIHKSDATLAQEAANSDIAAIKQALDNLDNTNSTLENRSTTLATTVQRTPAGVGFTEPPLNGATVTYTYKVNAATGTISVTATISKGTGTDVTSTFTIKGFQTTAQAQTIADQAAIDGVAIDDVTLPTPANNILPNTINKPPVQTINDATVTFTTWTPNNNDGTISWVVRVTKGTNTTPKTLSGTISGFQTTMEKAKADADALQATNLIALQAALKNGSVAQQNDKASVIAQRITNAQTLKTELGIDLTTLVTTSSYAISATGNAAGKIIVRVAMTTPGATTPLSTAQALEVAHKSDATLAQEAANRDIAAIKQALDNLDDTNSTLENRITTLATTVPKTPAGVGFTEPPLNGATVTYTYKVNAAAGTISVTATIKKGTGTDATSTFTIKGFQTTAQAQTIADQAAIDGVAIDDVTLPTPANNILPNTINKPPVQTINDATVTFTTWTPNNNDGTISWEVRVTKGTNTTPKTLSGTISGFQTTMEKAKADADALQATNLIALQAALKNGSVAQQNDKASVIAQRITNAQTLKTELGIDLTTLVTTSSYAISATGNAAGKIIVRVAMTTPGATTPLSTAQALEVAHKSDATLAQDATNRDIAAIKQALDNLDDTNSTLENRITTLATTVPKTPAGVGFTEPPLNGATVTYTYKVNAAAGTISVTATISKGTGTDATSTFTIKGFQTTAQAQTIADQAAIDGVAIDDVTLPTPANNILPNTINKPGPQTVNGATVTFTTWTPNNDEGKIVWVASVTKGTGTTPKIINGVLSGYQNQTQHDITISRNLIKALNNALTTQTEELASSLDRAWYQSDPKPDDYGFIEPNFPTGIKVDYALESYDDEKGELVIKATINKGSSEIEEEFTLKGFKTQNTADLESIKNAIEEISQAKKEVIREMLPITDAPFNEISLESLADNAEFPEDIKEATLTYSHNGITSDGTLTVNVKITKNDEEKNASFNVAIEGIDQAKEDRNNIEAAQVAINGISDLNLIVNNTELDEVTKEDDVTFNQDVFTSLGGGNLPTLPDDLTLNYYHRQINEDDKLIVSVNIAKGKVASKIAIFNVNVTGINTAKEVKKVKDSIDAIPDLNLEVNKEKIDAVTLSENQIFNQAVFESFGGNGSPVNLLEGVVLKYSHPELTQNGDLVVTINISKGNVDASASFTVVVTGINEFKEEEARKVITINEIKKIVNFTFSHEKKKMPSEVYSSIQDHVTLEAFTGAKFPDIQDKEKIKIVAEHNDEEGKLKLKIKVIPHGTAEENAEEIEKDVLGLTTKAQRDVQINEANRVIEEVKNAIKAELHQKEVWENLKNNYPSTLKNETDPIKIGFNGFNAPNGVGVTYKLIKADDAKGKAKVRATIKKEYGKSQIIDFHLQGYKKGVGKFSRLAIILISTGGASIFGILIFFFKTLFKKSTKKNK